MERYGWDFERDRWGGYGAEPGWRGQRYGGEFGEGGAFRGGWNEGEGPGEWRGGGPGNLRGRYPGDFEEWRGGMRGRYGAEFGGWGGGYQGGYGGYTEFLDERGYGGGWGRQRARGTQARQDRVRASEIMTENPEALTPDATLAEAARKMRDLDVGIIPIVDSPQSRRLRGVVTDRDIAVRAVAEGKDVNTTKVSEVMTTEVETCNKNDSVDDILRVMQREQVRRVPITDREGRLVGIVAQADVAVDYMGERPEGKREVARTLRQISEPAEPERGARGAAMQARGRGGAQQPQPGGTGTRAGRSQPGEE